MRTLLLVLCGCAPYYAYTPTKSVTANIEGRPAARHAIPPRGEVRVTSFGVADLAIDGDKVRVLHVRMEAGNDSDTPWSIDTHQQMIRLPGVGHIPPELASSDAVEVPVREQRQLDLYYPLPIGMAKIPEFDFLWSLQAGTRTVSERTPFEAVAVNAQIDVRPSTALGTGPYYWWHYPYRQAWVLPPQRVAPVTSAAR